MSVTYLTRTQGTGTSRQKWTLSMWIKKTGLSGHQGLMSTNNGWQDGSGMAILFEPTGVLNIYNPIQGATGAYNQSTRVFTDTNAFYHFVFSADSTLATQADRLKIYVNGEQLSYATSNLPGQNIFWNDLNFSGQSLNIGSAATANDYFNGSMSHVHFVDGTTELPTVFGEYDANGVWKIKTSPSVTYGANGFFILKDGNGITDQSGQGNDFTNPAGSVTKTEDNPSNVFNTFNAVDNLNNSIMSNGNTSIETDYGNYSANTSTLRAFKGKFYWEIKAAAMTGGGSNEVDMVGINNASSDSATKSPALIGINYRGNGKIWNYGGTAEATGYATFGSADIIMVAMDLSDATTGKLYFGKDGTWGNSGNPVTGAGSYNFTKGNDPWGAMVTTYSSGSSGMWQANFGNGYFASTQISPAGTNASGNGIFKHTVPTGYTALSTKGLNL